MGFVVGFMTLVKLRKRFRSGKKIVFINHCRAICNTKEHRRTYSEHKRTQKGRAFKMLAPNDYGWLRSDCFGKRHNLPLATDRRHDLPIRLGLGLGHGAVVVPPEGAAVAVSKHCHCPLFVLVSGEVI